MANPTRSGVITRHGREENRIQGGRSRVLSLKMAMVGVFSCGKADDRAYSTRTEEERIDGT
jgi:hypothetical protein